MYNQTYERFDGIGKEVEMQHFDHATIYVRQHETHETFENGIYCGDFPLTVFASRFFVLSFGDSGVGDE